MTDVIALLDKATMRVADFGNLNIKVIRRDEAEAIVRSLLSAVHDVKPISEVSTPLAQAINEPCKGCGKRPIEFMK